MDYFGLLVPNRTDNLSYRFLESIYRTTASFLKRNLFWSSKNENTPSCSYFFEDMTLLASVLIVIISKLNNNQEKHDI